MVTDSELVGRLREFLRNSDLTTTTTGIVRRQLEEDFGIDLSNKKAFIREQVDVYLQSRVDKAEENEEEADEGEGNEDEEAGVKSEEVEEEGEEEEEEEEGEDDDEGTSNGKAVTKRRLVNCVCQSIWSCMYMNVHAYGIEGLVRVQSTFLLKRMWYCDLVAAF